MNRNSLNIKVQYFIHDYNDSCIDEMFFNIEAEMMKVISAK